MRRSLYFLAVLALSCLISGDHAVVRLQAAPEAKKVSAPYVHAVIFHMKKDAPADAVESFVSDCHALLAKIPTVRELRAGRPAAKDSTTFVKKDYSVALVILFDDHAGLMTYVEHPLHKKFVENHLKNLDTEKLSVFDFENQMK